ncbi:peptide ABC transporter substrate-binding protein [Nostoc sp. T09]|uniref:ABC transporter substrate-binding protein n=1 Tax=Nostoc sp. T09 TaxID=1932621 RepID=UPI000A36D3D5|nr:ABC transporter substrate-binding protein [Nostoc sp. T09]OUL36317.1 peptide ABC transporter substrate-binding protein [Nostoc sp. T09]
MIFAILRHPKRLLTLVLACFLIIVGCQPTKFQTRAAQEVSQLVLVSLSEPATFNYAINDSPYSVFPFIYKGLLDEDGITSKLKPGLAESWSIFPDKKRIIFTLRKGLKWSDGEPLTADDVIFSYRDIYLNKKIPTTYRDLLRIGDTGTFPSVRKLDEQRVEFTLPAPFAPFLRYTERLAILPAHALRSAVFSNDANGNPQFLSMWGTNTDPQKIICNGSYTIESYTPAQRVTFRRNPYYWRKDAQGNSQPYIERIIWQIISSTDNQLLRFRSGELDSLNVTPSNFGLLKREEKRGKYSIYNGGTSSGFSFIGFNLNQARNAQGKPFVDPIKSQWFNNLAFRQAVAYAIDRNRIKTNIYRGLGEVQHSPIAVQSPYYLSPQAGLKVYNYNPNKAREMLLSAGFQYNSQKELLDRNGKRVEFEMLVKSEDQSRIDAAIQIQQDLSQIGIKANLQVVSFNVVLRRLLSRRDWDCYVGAFGATGADVEPHLLKLFWSSRGSFHQFNQGPQPGAPPIQGWVVSDWEKAIDSLFNAGVQELDEKKRQAIYGRFQQIVAEQLPVFFLVNPISLQAIRDRVVNIKYSGLSSVFWNIDEWQITDK